MMTKLIDCFYRCLVSVMVWCVKSGIHLAPTWKEKIDMCNYIDSIVDGLLESHWTEARRAGIRLLDVQIDVYEQFEKEFKEMEAIYYGEEEP